MSRPSQTESAYVQTFVRSPDLRAFMSRLSCVHQTFVRSCPDFRAFTRLSCVHVQTFVRSCPDFRAFDRLSCVHQTFVRSPDFRAFMSRLSCVHQTFVRSCPDFRAFFLVSRPCKFERTTPPSCVHLGLDISTFRLGPQPGLLFGFPNKLLFIFLFPYSYCFRGVIDYRPHRLLQDNQDNKMVDSFAKPITLFLIENFLLESSMLQGIIKIL